MADCALLQITIFTELNYNNDGDPAPELPTFSHFTFKNIDLSKASTKEPVININGFKDPAHRLKDVSFSDIILPEDAKVVVNDAERVQFKKVQAPSGKKPAYVVTNSTDIHH